MKKKQILFLLILLAGLSLPARSFSYDHKLKWWTLNTEHFQIHYHEGLEKVAPRMAKAAEEVHEHLVPLMKWKPRTRVQVVLTDHVDTANGSANPIPYNTVRMYVSPPEESNLLDYYDTWLKALFMHEYTHTLHMDTIRGLPKIMRYIFGRILAINGIHPIFLIEGLAVYNETEGTSGGRARSTDTEMFIRASVIENRFPPIDRWCTFVDVWPAGRIPYLFGGMFHKYVAEKYGNRFGDLSVLHSGQTFPWLYNHNMKKIYGKSLYELYAEFQAHLSKKYWEQKREITAQGLTESRRITTSGNYTGNPRFSPDGWYLLWEERTFDHMPTLLRMDLQSGKIKKILKRESGGGVSWSPLGRRLVYEENRVYRIEYEYNDLWLYDFTRKKKTRLTRGLRARDPAFAPYGRDVLCVVDKAGTNNLVLVDTTTGEPRFLTDNREPYLHQYSGPRFSPDGKRIVLSVKEDGVLRDVYFFDPSTGAFRRLTYHRARDFMPTFAPDGKTVLFVSDRSGVSNIYALDLDQERLYRVTNVLGGAFAPEVSPDGKTLAFVGYSADGYDVHLTDLDPSSWVEVPYSTMTEEDAPATGLEQEIAGETGEDLADQADVHRYRPYWTLLPRWWFPYIATSGDEVLFGLTTGGHDVLYKHSYSAGAYYWPQSEFVNYYLTYRNHIIYPRIGFSHSRGQAYFGKILEDEDGDSLRYYEKRLTFRFGLGFPITKDLWIGVSYRYQDRDNISEIPDATEDPPDVGVFSGGDLEVSYSNARSYRRSISPECGGSYNLDLSVDDAALGSEYDVQIASAVLRQYLGIPGTHHVFALRAAAGIAGGDRLRQRAFRLGGFYGVNPFNLPTTGRFFLRGYPGSQFLGQRVLSGSLEYRFPIWYPQRGLGTLPFFLDHISAVVFGDTGNAWDATMEFEDLKSSAGVELRIRTIFSFGYPISLRFGAARGFDEHGVWDWLVSLGGSF